MISLSSENQLFLKKAQLMSSYLHDPNAPWNFLLMFEACYGFISLQLNHHNVYSIYLYKYSFHITSIEFLAPKLNEKFKEQGFCSA